jgi:hypothetical protein
LDEECGVNGCLLFILSLLSCGCIAAAVYAGDLQFDSDSVSHPFDGMGTQIWSGDSSVQSLLSSLQIRYIRIEAFPNWASAPTPPTDGQRSSFDQYVSNNYGTSRLTTLTNTCTMLNQLGVRTVFNQFHYPSAWRTAGGELRVENHQDVALLWGAQVAYLQSHGILPDYVDLFNEPEGTWNCRVPPAQYNDVLKRVRQEMDDRGLSAVQIIGPGLAYLDHDGGGALWVGALDAAAVASLGAFSTHAWDESFNQGCGPEWLRQEWQPFRSALLAKDPDFQHPIFVTEYMTGNRIFHGIEYPGPGSNYAYSASDTLPFAVRVFEHTLSFLNGGASVPFLWEASDQSWTGSGWGLQRRASDGSAKRPTYYAIKALTDLVPAGSWVLAAPPQEDNDLYCAAFRHEDVIMLAAANGTLETKTKTVTIDHDQVTDFVRSVSYSTGGTGTGEGMFTLSEPNQIILTLPSDSILVLSLEAAAEEPPKALEWKFEGSVTDSSGNGNHATTATGGFSFARGRFGQAVAFDGTEAVIERLTGTNLPLAATDDWSMNLWVYTDNNISVGGDYHALALAVIGTNSWSKNGNARSIGNWGWGGGISFYSTTMVPTSSKVPYDVGAWQMITITYENALWAQQGTDTTGQSLKIYKNGVQIASFNPQGRYYTGGFRTADNRVNLLPTIPDAAPMRFTGKLDEFTIWRGVLSPQRIGQLASLVPVTGDLSGDRQVDLMDLAVLCGYWLSDDNDCVADLNSDQFVDLEDFAALAGSL